MMMMLMVVVIMDHLMAKAVVPDEALSALTALSGPHLKKPSSVCASHRVVSQSHAGQSISITGFLFGKRVIPLA